MTVLTTASSKEVTRLLDEVLSSARYLVDANGDKTDVVLPLSAWDKLLVWLEEADDRAVVQEWLPRLKLGPVASGALRWEEVSSEWDDDDSI